MKDKIKIGISQGDINGISCEVIIKTLMDPRMNEICTPVIFGSPKVLAYHRKALEIENFAPVNIQHAGEARSNKTCIINCVDDNIRVELGKNTREAGMASLAALEAATTALEKGQIDALVTGPINKENVKQAGFTHSGHTEYLQEHFGAEEVMMLMCSDLMKVGLVAGHVPVARLSEHITTERVLKKLKILSSALLSDFGIRNPRIAVLGLNPHAGDNGVLGHEEIERIVPALEQARKMKILAFGPFPADGFFGAGRFSQFDAVLAMYHDQGLTPFKALTMDQGVNYTAGLPVVRTSPAHGTAFELAGKNEASATSFRNAIFTAVDVVRQRRMHQEITSDPMGSTPQHRGGRDDSPRDHEKTEP